MYFRVSRCAAHQVEASATVLSVCSVSVAQWKQQFLQFSNISERQICAFTQGEKEMVSSK
jgi:DNA excision repair protein ERCC-3